MARERLRGEVARRLFRHARAQSRKMKQSARHGTHFPGPAVQTRVPHTLARAPEQHTFFFAVEFSTIAAVRGADLY